MVNHSWKRIEIGDICEIRKIGSVLIDRPCFARVTGNHESNIKHKLVCGGYLASSNWSRRGRSFSLPWVSSDPTSDWSYTSEEDAQAEYWAAIAKHALLGEAGDGVQ